jgi:hypothetical protein
MQVRDKTSMAEVMEESKLNPRDQFACPASKKSVLPRSARWWPVLLAPAAIIVPAAAQNQTPPLFFDFNGRVTDSPVVPYSTPGGVPAAVDVKVADGALTMTNKAGGSFGVTFKMTPFDPDQLSYIAFDYRVDKETKVDLFLRVNGKYHGIGFTGPVKMRPGSILLGRVPGVRVDGQWHRAVLPVRDWLRSLYPKADSLKVDEFIAGNWNNEGYLMAGIGGNGPGASWSIDNLALLATSPADKADFTRAGAATYSLDGETPKTSGQFGRLSDGYHTIVIRDKKGDLLATVPYLAASSLKAGTPQWQGNDIVLPLTAPNGLDTKALKLKVDNKEYALDSPFLKWEIDNADLRFAAGDAGLSWKQGDTVSLILDGFKDARGTGPGTASSVLTMEYGKHDGPMEQPRVTLEGIASLGDGTFENSLDQWGPQDMNGFPGAVVERVKREDAMPGNEYAVRLTCPRTGTPFGTRIRQQSFDASQFPIISFDYKATDRLRLDFRLNWNGTPYSIKFTDRDTQTPRLGTVDGVTTDGRWHHAEIPLLRWMKQTRPDATTFQVDNLGLADDNWLGNARGVQVWFDNFQFVPRINGTTVNGQVQLSDVTGLKGLSWSVDMVPLSMPDQNADGTNRFQISGDGRCWLHIRAQNGAGAWGPAAHTPLLFEKPAPPPTAVTTGGP